MANEKVTGEFEKFLENTILKVGETHARVVAQAKLVNLIPELKTSIQHMATAQDRMSAAAERMALSYEKSEDARRDLQATNTTLSTGKGQMPISSFFLIVGTLCLVIVNQSLSKTGTDVQISATEFKMMQKRIAETEQTSQQNAEAIKKLPEKVKEEVIQEVKKVDDK